MIKTATQNTNYLRITAAAGALRSLSVAGRSANHLVIGRLAASQHVQAHQIHPALLSHPSQTLTTVVSTSSPQLATRQVAGGSLASFGATGNQAAAAAAAAVAAAAGLAPRHPAAASVSASAIPSPLSAGAPSPLSAALHGFTPS